jgi:hypothetical protein
MSSYIYPLDILNNNPPRAFIYGNSNNAELKSDALVLNSLTPQTSLRFINSNTDQNLNPNFLFALSNESFSVQKNDTTIIDYNIDENMNAIVNVYGNITTNNLAISSNYPNYKAIVFQDFDTASCNQFAGIGYSNDTLNFQLPQNQNKFTFTKNTNQLLTIQEDIYGNSQLGIGVSNIESGLSLQVGSNAFIDGTLSIKSLKSPTTYIDLNYSHLCNLSELDFYQLGVASIVSTCNQTIKFNNANILDVDNLIVRNNITVLNSGLYSYCNLPINTVFTDSNTGTINDTIMSSNIPRLQTDGTLNPALFPPGYSSRSTLLRTQDKVGIGLRYPQQKLHVSGNQCITDGRLSIGITDPVATFDIYDNSASPFTFQIVNLSSTDMMRIYSNDQIVFNITANRNIGILNPSPLYPLDVNGDIHTNSTIYANRIRSDNSIIDCSDTSFSNLFNLNVKSINTESISSLNTNTIDFNNTDLLNISSINIGSINRLERNTNIEINNAVHITGFDTILYDNSDSVIGGDTNDITKIGLKVDECILARSVLTISDKRTKKNITSVDSSNYFNKLLKINVANFDYINNSKNVSGLIAQELEEIYPEAVNTISEAIPNILRKYAVSNNKIIKEIKPNIFEINKSYKFFSKNSEEYIRKVIYISTDGFIEFDKILLLDDEGCAYIYGEYVSDFKVINYDRLIPLLISSIQELNKKINL